MLTGKWYEFVGGVSARVNEIIDDTKDLGPSFIESGLWDVVSNPDDLIYRTEGVTGLNYLELFDESGAIKKDETFPQYKTEYIMRDQGKIVEFSQKLMKTRPAMLESKLNEVRQLIISANRSLNKNAWMVLVDGFSTSDSNSNFPTHRLNDGVSLYSTAHPSRVAGVSNRSNQVASNPTLSETDLFTATKMIEEQLNGRGLPMNYEGNYLLVVPPALRKLAKEITGSVQRSGTGNNDLNYFSGGFMDFLVVNYLGAANGGSDTAWYVFAKDVPEGFKGLKYVSLISPKVEQETDFDTKNHKVSIDKSDAFGYSNWEFTVASDGTNS